MSRDRSAAITIARGVAPLLSGNWRAEQLDEGECAYLVRADGAEIGLDVGGYRRDGRVAFWGLTPKYKDGTRYWGGGPRPQITCSATRSHAELAREVARRLLPQYDHAFAEALAYVTKHDASMDEAEAVAQRLAGVVGGTAGPDVYGRKRHGDGVEIRGVPHAVHRLLVRHAYHGIDADPVRVDFEVHGLAPQTAAEVLAVIKAAEERRDRQRDADRMRLAGEAADAQVLEEDEVVADERAARRRIG